MALDFNDAQIKTMSLDVIELPKVIDFPLVPETGEGGTGLIQQQENVIVLKNALYTTDQQNKVFTDHWTLVADQYHLELEKLSLNNRTTYLDSDLVLGAQSFPPHYTETHPELVPIVIPSMNGNPIVPSAFPENHVDKLASLDSLINTYINGKSGSSNDQLLENWVDGVAVEVQSGEDFTTGELVFVTQGSNIMLAEVLAQGGFCTGETPPESGIDEATCIANMGTWTYTITLTALSTPYAFSSGADITNSMVGFTNAERGRQVGQTIDRQNLMEFFEAEINNSFIDIQSFQQDIVDNLLLNDDTNATRKTDNQTFIDASIVKINEIDAWEAETIIAVDGRYTDDKLPAIQTSISGLTALNTDRIAQIITMLGNVTDNGGGDVTGEGVYFDNWKFVVIRIAKSGGTLYGWYGMDLAVQHFDIKIANANSQLEEYENIIIVKKITEDVELGENEVTIENVIDLSEDDSIKVFDNESAVFNTTIQSINGNIVTLDQSLPFELLTGSIARLVKVK